MGAGLSRLSPAASDSASLRGGLLGSGHPVITRAPRARSLAALFLHTGYARLAFATCSGKNRAGLSRRSARVGSRPRLLGSHAPDLAAVTGSAGPAPRARSSPCAIGAPVAPTPPAFLRRARRQGRAVRAPSVGDVSNLVLQTDRVKYFNACRARTAAGGGVSRREPGCCCSGLRRRPRGRPVPGRLVATRHRS